MQWDGGSSISGLHMHGRGPMVVECQNSTGSELHIHIYSNSMDLNIVFQGSNSSCFGYLPFP
jgi:hypothetical protein